jgi:hypothetical protein
VTGFVSVNLHPMGAFKTEFDHVKMQRPAEEAAELRLLCAILPPGAYTRSPFSST